MSHESLTAEAVHFPGSSRDWHAALTASVVLHLLMLAALLQLRPGTAGAVIADSPHQVVTVLVRPRALERKEAPTLSSSEAQVDPADATAPVPELPAAVAPVSNQVEVATEYLPPVTTAVPQGQGTLSQDDIRASIAKFSAEFTGELTAEWVSDCMRFRERYATGECPRQQAEETSALDEGNQIASTVFAGVTRANRHRRLTNSLLAENDRLEDLMEEGGELGGLARERYYLNREYLFYLNGNFNFGAWSFVKTSNASNGNLEFMRGFLQFQCKESPCIYEFTGIGAKPASTDEAQVNAGAAEEQSLR